MIHYEDMSPGDVALLGPTDPITAEDIVAFARRYDPQPFHLSDAGARDTYFETLSASGWHTAALTMRLLMTGRDEPLASLGSPGFDDLRWRHPVRVGDRLSVRCEVTDKRLSNSRPEMGLVHFAIETRNQRDTVVMSYRTVSMLARRETAE